MNFELSSHLVFVIIAHKSPTTQQIRQWIVPYNKKLQYSANSSYNGLNEITNFLKLF